MTNRDSRGRFIPMTPDERVAAHVARVNERHPFERQHRAMHPELYWTDEEVEAMRTSTTTSTHPGDPLGTHQPWGTKRVITDAEVEAEHRRQADEILERWRVEQYAKVRRDLEAERFPQAAISKPVRAGETRSFPVGSAGKTRTQPLEYETASIGAFMAEHWMWAVPAGAVPAALGLIGLAWYLAR